MPMPTATTAPTSWGDDAFGGYARLTTLEANGDASAVITSPSSASRYPNHRILAFKSRAPCL